MKATVVLYTVNKVKEKWSETGKEKKLIYYEHPLFLVLRDRSKIKRISLGVSLPPKHWNKKTRRWQNLSLKIDSLIKTTEAKYAAKIKELTESQLINSISLDTLYEMVERPAKNDYQVLEWMEKLVKDFKEVDRIGQANVYDNSRRLLALYLKDKDIKFAEIDLAFLNRYEHFLRQRKIKDSSVSIYMRTLRAAIAKAVNHGYCKDMPFKDYRIPKGKANKRALSMPEIEAIIYLKERNEDYKPAGRNEDYYYYTLFSYYTIGMNFTDMARLTWDNIRSKEIHYTRQKIHQSLIIPIHPKADEIIDHYRPLTGNTRTITGKNDSYIFPILDKNVHNTEAAKENRIRKILKEFNAELKTIGAAAKIDTVLTSYVLRHTAITNLVKLGITADAVQALAGHKRLTTTENYIREASQEVKAKAVNML